MAKTHHRPEADAPASEWKSYLKGRGYVEDSKEKPVTNYKSMHGYWVPPRLGSTSKGGSTTVARTGRTGSSRKIEAKWYSERSLTELYMQNRPLFTKLTDRIANISELVKDRENAERLDAQRRLIEPAVEAGLLNQAEADRKVAAWAKAEGIKVTS